ncbi:AMP-binding enzyme [Nocardia nova]|uniref:AMP-binding enzyme n=1 Tax=Nocardia nova TaxID=37330 RepID=UPI003183546E
MPAPTWLVRSAAAGRRCAGHWCRPGTGTTRPPTPSSTHPTGGHCSAISSRSTRPAGCGWSGGHRISSSGAERTSRSPKSRSWCASTSRSPIVAVVGVPDDVYGERVCAVVVLADGATLDAPGLSNRLASRGVTKEYTPEYVVVVDRLDLGPGGKTDRAAARDTAMRMLGLR